MNNKKKRKGGAEKIRLKKQKLLEASGQKCVKLTSVFKCSSSSSTSTSDAVAEVVTEMFRLIILSILKKDNSIFLLNIIQTKTLVILCYKGPYIAKMGPNASG
ncbi:hypothetical protein MTP99_001582 [Tenebrio molitor]|nr:hypothetical protein MTP99_001582 [Tenebrio molitor]